MRTPAALLLAAALAGCGQTGTQTEDVDATVTKVTLPAQVTAEGPLDVAVEVQVGGCERFSRFVAERTATRLTLRAVGTRTLNAVCPAYLGWQTQVYTDPGTPARTDPFEVVVNGKSWGTVEVR